MGPSWDRNDWGVLGYDCWHPAKDVTGDQDNIMDITGTPGHGAYLRGHQPSYYDPSTILRGPHDETSISLKWMIIKVKIKMILLSYHFWDINVFQLGRIVWSCSIHCHICVEYIIPLLAVPFKANKHTHWAFGCKQLTSQSEKCTIECLPWLSKQTGMKGSLVTVCIRARGWTVCSV